jgi:uncharacterized protein (TIGR00255 family)
MTGFGKAEAVLAGKKVTIQTKSLNSKQADINLRLPQQLKEKEIPIRKQILEQLQRGKIECTINVEAHDASEAVSINEPLMHAYFKKLETVRKNLGVELPVNMDILSRLPEVFKQEEENPDQSWFEEMEKVLLESLQNLNEFRANEGAILAEDLKQNIAAIYHHLEEALQYEKERSETVRQRIRENLEEASLKGNLNEDRYEQELIYYLEKLDISEEKVRLRTHCDYFLECMQEAAGQGKKLAFISQEIGREINTLGSKANHAEMQKSVVHMKDALEKIKEQVLNVL